MSLFLIRAFDATYSYEPGFSFAADYAALQYVFQKGSNLLALLYACKPFSGIADCLPQVYASADSGATWAQVSSSEPGITIVPVLYDANCDPAASLVTLLYGTSLANTFLLVDYTYGSAAFGTPYGPLSLFVGTHSDLVTGFVRRRSDGSGVLFYDSPNTGTYVCRTFSSGSWSAPILSAHVTSLAVDSSDNIHIVSGAGNGAIDYYIFDTSNSISTGPIRLQGATVSSGNISNTVITGTTVQFAALDVSRSIFRLFTGVPPYDIGSWSNEDISNLTSLYSGEIRLAIAPATNHTLVFAQSPFRTNPQQNTNTYLSSQSIAADVVVYAMRPGDIFAGPPRQTKIDRFIKTSGVWSGPVNVYSAPFNLPPDDWSDVTIWHLNVMTGAIPPSVSHTTNSYLKSLAVTVQHTTNSVLAGSSMAGNKYRAFYQ